MRAQKGKCNSSLDGNSDGSWAWVIPTLLDGILFYYEKSYTGSIDPSGAELANSHPRSPLSALTVADASSTTKRVVSRESDFLDGN